MELLVGKFYVPITDPVTRYPKKRKARFCLPNRGKCLPRFCRVKTTLELFKRAVTDRIEVTSLGGGTGRRTGLKNTLTRVFNSIRDLSKTNETIVQTHDWRGFLADLLSKIGVKRPKTHRRQIGDMKTGVLHGWRTYNYSNTETRKDVY